MLLSASAVKIAFGRCSPCHAGVLLVLNVPQSATASGSQQALELASKAKDIVFRLRLV